MALLGQNGAGKTTLIKILGGAIPPDKGEFFLKGKKVRIRSPKDAYNLGFSFIFQEGGLIEGLSVLENIFLGFPYPKKGIKINWKELIFRGERLKQKTGIDVQLTKYVEDLSPLERKKAEVLKALARNPKILVLDEPTSTLDKRETVHLFNILKDLKTQGIGIIYISHFLDELFEIADRVTVLRDGKKVGVFDVKETTRESLISYEIGGKEVIEKVSLSPYKDTKVLKVEDLSTYSGLKNISFSLHKGEMLGIFGQGGQGKTRLAMALSGLSKIKEGKILKNERKIYISSPKDALFAGIVLVPQDRKQYGIIEEFTVSQNLTLPILKTIRKQKHIPIPDRKKEFEKSLKVMKKLNIKANTPEILTKTLSGGNKQKTVIGKGLLSKASIFILDEPTQGLDIMAREEVYRQLIKFSEEGISQIIISSDIEELFKITHRIMIMKDGMIKEIVSTQDTSLEKVLSISYGGNYANN